MVDAEIFGAKPKISRTPTTSFSNPAYEHLATESDLPDPSLLGDNLFAESVPVISPRNSAQAAQPTVDLFTERYGDIDARYAAEFPAVVNNPITKAKNSISSRLRSNPTYKLVDQLEKTPPRKSWSKNKNNQSEKSAAQSFFTRLVSRLSPAQSSFSSTPVGRISQSFTNYLDKRSADGKSSRRANSPLIPRQTDTQTAKDPNENAQRAKNNSSATCATSGDKENESDWETCSDCSTDSDNEKNKIIRGKEDVREDVTETLQENTNEEETIQNAEIGVEPSTSASPNKVKKKVGQKNQPTQLTLPPHPLKRSR
ncbi:hypothetical protein DAPPUDRAFT_114986 [Daphnia pulex]|uniref:Uncharacterized protein n=1 Tax=Daphnia pulex TaxID=6669 RepID=E9HJW0_DAPPU|nr:hypothetical protein DAPPUDRAFT_114986 [Daphnia pulex]|eukprot:EFX67937.1 hypothetical protein DAPPUDRAFT_114986 [Daphnia pulex]